MFFVTKKSVSQKSAFALAEVLVGVAILATVFLAVSNMVFSSLRANQITMTSLQAYGLAQEGIELVRFVRDSHWRRNVAWNGSVGTDVPGVIANISQASCYTISFDSRGNGLSFTNLLEATPDQVFQNASARDKIGLFSAPYQNTALFTHDTSDPNVTEQSRFGRFVCLNRDSDKKMTVTSVVSWKERWNTIDKPSTIELKTELTDWKEGAL